MLQCKHVSCGKYASNKCEQARKSSLAPMTRLRQCLSRRRQIVAVHPPGTTRPAGCWSPMRSPRPQPPAEMSRTAPAPTTKLHRPLVRHWASPLSRSHRGRLLPLADGLCGRPVAKARQCPADFVPRGAASPAVPAECLLCPLEGSP